MSAGRHYIVEIRTAHGEWIRKAWYRSKKKALAVAENLAEAGFKARVLDEGKIVWESGE